MSKHPWEPWLLLIRWVAEGSARRGTGEETGLRNPESSSAPLGHERGPLSPNQVLSGTPPIRKLTSRHWTASSGTPGGKRKCFSQNV